MGKLSRKKKDLILVVELEPTPYKTDLWNAYFDLKNIELFVIYVERKNWLPDGGHNYLKLPFNKYKQVILSGKGVIGKLQSALFVAKKILLIKPSLVCITGYAHFPNIVAICMSIIFQKKFVIYADELNNLNPTGNFWHLKLLIRSCLRRIIFQYTRAIIVCGKRGVEAAKLAGCAEEKILNIPYFIDIERIRSDFSLEIPKDCSGDVDGGSLTVIFFSGRMIERKGLGTLLAGLSDVLLLGKKWVLWIEGDGPDLEYYRLMAKQLGVWERCKFLGFCQYDIHSWLIRSSDIVVVPSLADPWGIVVDEGMQLGKVVISSDATGCGYDRIRNRQNGFIFPAGDQIELSNLLSFLVDDAGLRKEIGSRAESDSIQLAKKIYYLLDVIGAQRSG